MRSIIWTTNEEFAKKLLTQIIGSQPVIRKRQTNAEYWIEYGDEYNIVYWIRGNDCFCGLRCVFHMWTPTLARFNISILSLEL